MEATPLSEKATEIFFKIFDHTDEDGCLKLNNAPGIFMEVSGEMFLITGAYQYYLAHYFEQNGDLMHDPSITFIEVCSTKKVYALDITQSATGTYQEPCFYKGGQVHVISGKEQQHKELTAFAEQWLNNIKSQQGI